MRYHYKKSNIETHMYGETYRCNHPVYDECTLYKIGKIGIGVIQQRFNYETKTTSWGPIDSWLTDDVYLQLGFKDYFYKYAKEMDNNGLYPTVTIRQIMWALKMKPLLKLRWETVFDRKNI